MYLDQIVPAPEGWTLHGKALPGEEIYYATDDGLAQIFPHPDSGWELQFRGGDHTLRVPTPQVGFDLVKEARS